MAAPRWRTAADTLQNRKIIVVMPAIRLNAGIAMIDPFLCSRRRTRWCEEARSFTKVTKVGKLFI